MTRYSWRDVVLVRFPFTDLASIKKRPALILSPQEYVNRYGDVVLLALTSRSQPNDSLRLADWQAAGLPKPTWLKPLIATLSATLVIRRLGRLVESDTDSVRLVLHELLATEAFGA